MPSVEALYGILSGFGPFAAKLETYKPNEKGKSKKQLVSVGADDKVTSMDIKHGNQLTRL